LKLSLQNNLSFCLSLSKFPQFSSFYYIKRSLSSFNYFFFFFNILSLSLCLRLSFLSFFLILNFVADFFCVYTMPQVDLETLVSACAGGSDRKIACETLADGDHRPEQSDQPEVPPDFPPESFWLSKDAELDWFDQHAFYERKDSGKGNGSGNGHSTNLNPNLNPSSNSNSQRFSLNLKSKASILGLPKPQKSCFVDAKSRRNTKPGNTRLFPKRSGSVGKSDAPMVEPSSPKVSCMGRVRSKRDRNRRLRNRQLSAGRVPEKEKTAGKRKTGFFATFRSLFRAGRRDKPAAPRVHAPQTESPPRKSSTMRARDSTASDFDVSFAESLPRHSVSEIEAPGLGGMNRFASGRRSDAWADDVA
jgi:hypothetical protein